MYWLKTGIIATAAVIMMASCNDEKNKPTDTLSSGNIDISVDETYKPIIEEELKVFDSSYPDAKINIHYKPESDCFKDFFDNKAHLILVTRDLSSAEKQQCDQKQIAPTSLQLVKDAVAVVVNNTSPDSVLSLDAIKGILTGTYKKKYTVVFDNQGSSTVRYITDSLLAGQKLGSNVFAAKGNYEVIDYVKKNPDAIGFVGLSYVMDTTAKSSLGTFIQDVKVASVYNDTAKSSFKPYQAYIALKDYPLTRGLFYINRDSYVGLSRGFANFLASARGQLIFGRAYMFPLQMGITIRDAAINP